MSDRLPTFLRSCRGPLGGSASEWQIKGDESVVVAFANQCHWDELQALFDCESDGDLVVANDVTSCGRIYRIALSANHMVGGLVYESIRSKNAIVLRDIAVRRAWQRTRIASSLLASIVQQRNEWREPTEQSQRSFDMVMAPKPDAYELKGFLTASGFKTVRTNEYNDVLPMDAHGELYKASILLPGTNPEPQAYRLGSSVIRDR